MSIYKRYKHNPGLNKNEKEKIWFACVFRVNVGGQLYLDFKYMAGVEVILWVRMMARLGRGGAIYGGAWDV